MTDFTLPRTTARWTLYHRAAEARREDAVLRDPMAVELVERIDYPFETRFGSGEGFSQWQALRARCFDDAVLCFLTVNPEATVVALGEGLETQFWGVDNGSARWLTVDLPEVVELRDRLLPRESRVRALAGSALDEAWAEEVDTAAGVLVTAQGLLMYFASDDARGLVSTCAERFRGGGLVFDVVPSWLVERSRRGKLRTESGYEPLGLRRGGGEAAAGSAERCRAADASPAARARGRARERSCRRPPGCRACAA